MLLVTVAALFLVCLPPEAVSQECRSGVTDEIRQSVREQLRQGQNGTISTVAVNCGQMELERFFITPRYAQNHATFISTIVSFTDTSIYFGPWNTGSKLLEVPLISAGRFARNESIAIQITATINGGMLNSGRDRDPILGVTDGNTTNLFGILDITNYPIQPCILAGASGMTGKVLNTGPVPDQFTFLFKPAERFGACSSAQQGGYVNVGLFNNQLDLSKGINLAFYRGNELHEDYYFYYALVEIFQE